MTSSAASTAVITAPWVCSAATSRAPPPAVRGAEGAAAGGGVVVMPSPRAALDVQSKDDHEALDDLRDVGRDPVRDQRVLQEQQREGADEGATHAHRAAGERNAGDRDGGDRGELDAEPGVVRVRRRDVG